MSGIEPNSDSRLPFDEAISQQFVRARPVSAGGSPPPALTLLSPMDMREVTPLQAALDIWLVLMTAVVMQYVPELLIWLHGPMPPMGDLGWLVVASKGLELLLAVTLLAYFILRTGLAPATYGLTLRRFSLQLAWAGVTLIACYGAILVSALVIIVIATLVPSIQDDFKQRLDFARALPSDNLLVTVVLLVAVAIHEEIIFRALMIPALRRILGSWWSAVLVSSTVFAILHMPTQGVIAGLQVMLLGLVLGGMYVGSRSLLAVSLAHFAFNFIQFQLLRNVVDWFPTSEGP